MYMTKKEKKLNSKPKLLSIPYKNLALLNILNNEYPPKSFVFCNHLPEKLGLCYFF